MLFSMLAICADFKTAELERLGMIAWPERRDIAPFLHQLRGRFAIDEAFFLQSCNRREFYFFLPRLEGAPESFVRQFFPLLSQSLGREISPSWFRIHKGQAAVRHIFRVAASLESMVLGETEIMKQMKDQLGDSQQAGTSGRRLRTLVESALRTAKRVRSETQITRSVTSMASLIHRAVRDFIGERRGTVVFVGAGHFMETILPPFAKLTNLDFLFVNRSAPTELAARYGGRAQSLLDFLAEPCRFDVLVSATAAPHMLFTRSWLERLGRHPLLLVDGAVPQDIEPSCAELAHVKMFDIAGMEAVLSANRARRQAEVPKAEPIFDEVLAELTERWRELDLGEIHAGVAAYYEETAERALAHLFNQQAPELDEHQRQLLGHFSRSLVKRLVSVPVLGLKGVARELGEEGVLAWKRGVAAGSPLFG